MAQEQLRIEVSENGTRVVKRNIEEIGQSASETKGPVDALQSTLDKFTKIASRINSTLNSVNKTLKSLQQSLNVNSGALGEINKQGVATEAVTKRVAAATTDLAQDLGRSAAAAVANATALGTLAAATTATAAAQQALSVSTGTTSTAMVVYNGASATAVASNVALQTSNTALALTSSAAATSQLAFNTSLLALPPAATAGVFSMTELRQAIGATAAAGGSGGGGIFGGLAKGLGGLGDSAGRAAGALGQGFSSALSAARTGLSRVSDALLSAKTLFVAFLGSLAVGKIRELSDEYTKIQNQLRLTTTGQANLNAVFGELQDISTRTRSSLEANATLYSKISANSKELGVSQKDVLSFTEQFNKAVKISGANAAEASAGTLQLAQGLASGRLQGDELRSVLENLPAVADVIASHFKVTRGELRKMGEEGKIGAKDVLDAFSKAAGTLDEKFSKTIPTIGEGVVLLKNQLLESVGALNQTSGASETVGGWFLSITKYIKELTPTLVNMTRALSGTLDPMDELSDTGKVFATIFVTIGSVLNALAKTILTVVVGSFKTIGNVIGGISAAIGALLSGDFTEAGRIIRDTFTDAVSGMVSGTADLYKTLVDDTTGTVDKLVQIWDKGARQTQDRKALAVGEVGTEKGQPAAKTATAAEIKAMERLRNQLTSLLGTINPIPGAILEMQKAREVLTAANQRGLITDAELSDNLERLGDHYRDTLDPLGALNREIDKQAKLMSLSRREAEVEAQVMDASKQLKTQGIRLTREETQALRERFTALQTTGEVISAQDQLLSSSVEKRREFMTQLQAIQELLANPNSGFSGGDAAGAVVAIGGGSLQDTQVAATAQIAAVQDMYASIDALRQADLISETDAQIAKRNVLLQGTGELLANTQTAQQAQMEMVRSGFDQLEMLRAQDLINEQDYQSARLKLIATSFELQTANTSQFLGDVSTLMQSGNEKAFKIGKAAAVAQAAIQGGTAVMNALATSPWYVGAALAVAAAIRVKSQLDQIQAVQFKGYMAGGYTGSGPTNAIAGAVHGQEYVFDAASTKRLGVKNLDALRAQGSAGFNMGTMPVSPAANAPALPRIVINNMGTPQTYEQQSISREEIRLIARDQAKAVVGKEAPSIISSQIASPNSEVSKSLAAHTDTSRRR